MRPLLESFVTATYHLWLSPEKATMKNIDAIGRKIAVGQTLGTHSETDPHVIERYCAVLKEARILETLPHQVQVELVIDFPSITVQSDLGALLAVLFGKLSMAGEIRLAAINLPEELARNWVGPRYGIEGIRTILREPQNPLLMSIFKPCLGQAPEQLGEKLLEQARGGVHLVKDDEILADPDFDHTLKRLDACMKSVYQAEAELSRPILYAINLTGPAEKLLERARILVNEGANALLFNYLCYGLPMLHALSRDPQINVPIMAHPALAGGFYGSPRHGIVPSVLFGSLTRYAGADLTLFPSPYGSVSLPFHETQAITQKLSTPCPVLKRTFPVPSAGIKASMVSQLIQDFGTDSVINAGTGIHDHPDGSQAGAKQFVIEIQKSTAAQCV
jgi:2,3-diketo-5-methylthiopentyl-1-phosphate enolase